MYTTALNVMLYSHRPGWLGRMRSKLHKQGKNRLVLTDSVAPVEGDWDAVVVDYESAQDNLEGFFRSLPWSARLLVAESELNETERLHLLSQGAQAVVRADSNLFTRIRELVAWVRAEKRHGLSERLAADAEKMDALGRMALGVAHDFKHFVQVIQSGCSLLQRSLQDQKLLTTCADIKMASDQAHQLVSKLLSFASPQVSPDTTTDLSSFVSGYLPVLQSLRRTQVRLHTRLEARTLVRIDPVALSQALFNLVINAFDAIGESGNVWVETRDLKLYTPYLDERVRLEAGCYTVMSVSDDGCGIQPDAWERIFDPFYTTRSAQGGTGLGLSSVLTGLRTLGGKLTFFSRPGLGTTFQMFLPCSVELPPPPKMAGAILLIDSYGEGRQALRSGLECTGLTVCEACSWAQAEQAFADRTFQLRLGPLPLPEEGPSTGALSRLSPSLLLERGLVQDSQELLQQPVDLQQLSEWWKRRADCSTR